MGSSIYYIMALITLLLSSGAILLTLLRLNCDECKRARLKYTVVLIAAMAAALQPYFLKKLSGISSVLLVLSLLWLLVDGALPFQTHRKLHHPKANIKTTLGED